MRARVLEFAGFPTPSAAFAATDPRFRDAQLARRMGRAKPSAIMAVAEKAKRLKAEGRDIISFSIGVPNFLPGDHVYAAARDALAKDCGQYGCNRGADALLDAFLEHIEADRPDRLHAAPTAPPASAPSTCCTTWPRRCSTRATPSPSRCRTGPPTSTSPRSSTPRSPLLPCPAEQNYKLTPAQLDAALAKKPKVFLFNNPSNPTGMVYTKDEIAALADVLVKHPDTWIITDDIYNRMVFDGIGYHNFVHGPPGAARARDLRRLAVQDLRHARLARRLHGRPGSRWPRP